MLATPRLLTILHTKLFMATTSGLPRYSSLLVLLLFLSACSLSTDAEHGGSIEYRSLQVEGEERSFVLYRPKGVESTGAGLILAFHGWGMTGIGFQRNSELDRIAKEVGALIAYPDAASTHWAEDCDCVSADQTHGVADTAFVSAMIDGLTAEFGLDSNRQFAVGFSQGGLFVQRLACQMAHRFDAIVEVASTMAQPLAEGCEPSRPISLLTIISQRDEFFPWDGYEGGSYSSLGGEETAHFWGEMNQCSQTPERTEVDGVVRLGFTGCDGGARVELIGPEDGDHSWAISSNISTRKELISFLGG